MVALPSTMRAMVIRQFGTPEVFECDRHFPTPALQPGYVLVQAAATSVNPVDRKIRQGSAIAPEFPAVLHGDVAGTVVAVGAGVDYLSVGEAVYGCVGGVKGSGGALAEYVLADARLLAPAPQSLPLATAAALPLVSITAWEALVDRAQIQAGQRVLVYGGTGGVGHIGIQLAKAVGATVCAAVSTPAKAAIAHDLGADHTFLYPQEPVDKVVQKYTDGQGFDVVFDTVGNDNLQNAFQAAKLCGTVVSIVSRSSQDLTQMHSKSLTLHLEFMLIPLLFNRDRSHHGYILRQIAQLVDEGKLRPLIDPQSFSIDQVAQAHTYTESGRAIGKVLLTQT